MKTIISIRLCMFFLALTSMSITNLQADMVSYTIGRTFVTLSYESTGKGLLVNIENGGSENAILAIIDADGSILKEETIQPASILKKRYDLSRLPEGDYTLSFTKGLMEKVSPFTVTYAGIVLDESKAFEKYAPKITTDAKHLDVNLLLTAAGKVVVNITNASGEQVYTNTVSSVIVFNRRFNIAALLPGDYTVEVKTDDNSFYQDFVVE